jgi:hypothetical protein
MNVSVTPLASLLDPVFTGVTTFYDIVNAKW